jgi:hypothetical protein
VAYVYDTVSGRIAAIFHQTAPTPPPGYAYTSDAIQDAQIVDHKRDIMASALKKRDALKQVGSNSVPRLSVGQVAVQKIDGTTLADKAAVSDADPVTYVLENDGAFLEEDDEALVQGAASVKVAASAIAGSNRFLVFSPELQLLDGKVVFT